MKIILASQSPRRRELLARLGLPFSAQAPDIDETMEPGEDPAREVARVSRAKAMAVEAAPEDVVIAADTIVVCNGRVLGKPGTPEQAQQMLKLLSGRDHQVMTGLTVRRGATVLTETEVSRIFFRPLQEEKLLPMWRRESLWTKPAPMGFRGWPRCSSPGWKEIFTM